MEEDPDVLLREAEEAVAREAMLKSFPTVPKHRPASRDVCAESASSAEERLCAESLIASSVEERRVCAEEGVFARINHR